MFKYILNRLGQILVALFVVISLTFFLMQLAPGSPFASEQAMPPAIEEQLNEAYGLNNPWYIQYKDYLVSAAKLDFGESMKYKGRSTNEMIKESFPVSLALAGESLLISLGFGVILGIVSSMYHNRWPDYVSTVVAVLGISVPSFILAGGLQYYLGLKLGWLPISGWKGFMYTIMPALSLGLSSMGSVAKLTRSSMLEQNTSEYVKLAYAKGYTKWQTVIYHSLRNALLPVVTYIGPLIAGLITGSFVVENIFAIPGLGRHFVTSINNRDYTVIMGTTVFYAIILLLTVLAVDIIYMFLDPRIELKGEGE